MSCRYCAATLPDGRDICHFHAKTLRLARQGRCVWCERSPDEVVFPSTARSYCLECLKSRIRQGGGENALLNHAMWRARAA